MESADLARALEPAAKARDAEQRPLGECPSCGSRFMQPLAWRERPGDAIALALRCPECAHEVEGVFPAERVREYDLELREGRRRLRRWHRLLAAQNMRDAAGSFFAALDHDLITADDFSY